LTKTAPTVDRQLAPRDGFTESEKAVIDTILDITRTQPRATASEIAAKLETTITRTIGWITDLRAAGVLVAWDAKGYYFAQTFEQAEPTSDMLWQRALKAVVAARAYDRGMEQRFGVSKTPAEQRAYLFEEEEG
jgi:hypothetical protein